MKVEFVLDSDLFSSNFGQIRSDAPWGEQAGCDAGDAPLVFETRYLKEARVLVQNNLVRKYKFTYDITPPPSFVEDLNNQPCETGAIKLTRLELIGSNGTSTLWRRNFSYEDLRIHPYGYGHLLPAGITWPYLSTASNGFGGTTTYSYLDTHPKITDPQMWSRNLVQQLSQNPGIGVTQTKTIAYDSDSGPKFAKILVWDSGCSCFVQKYEQNPYRGFGHVTVTNADSTKEEYFFHTVLDVYLDDHRTGRAYDIYFKTASGTTIRRIQNTWTASDTGVPTVKFVRLDETIDTLGSTPRKTTYAYDAYGNVSQKLEYGDGTGWYRKTVTTYAYNTTANIVNKANTVTIYAQPDTVKAHSRFVYDNNASHEDAPIKGDLTRVERQKDSAGTIITWQTFTYDSYGNQLTAKDANNNGITVVYDTTLHLYPTSVTNALNQTLSYTWDTVLGKPLSKTDPNNVETNYRYDVFGRLEKLWDSIDSQTLPTVSIEYSWDDTATNYTLMRRRVDSGSTNALWTITHMDGFGRPVQVRNEWDAWNKAQVVDIAYNERGFKASQSLLYIATNSIPEGYTTPAPNVPRATYTYDVLGRVTQITNPDSTVRTFTYTNLTTQLIDEKGHRTDFVFDAFGRRVKVEEYTGTSGSGFSLYATTTFGYDVLDRQTAITDNLNNSRSFTYNPLGFLTALTDPDRGNWSFTPDDAGRLLSMTDARNITTTYSHDALNRVTQKSYSNGDPTVNFYYDSDYLGESGNYPKGRLTKMVDGSGTTLYKYDRRGRQTKERRTIDGSNYDVAWTYNSLGNVLTLTYPDGESVSHSYNSAELLVELKRNISVKYVKNATYAAHGAPATIELGNNRITTYAYNSNNLRLQSIVTDGSLQNLSYTYDDVGNVTQITDPVAGEATTFGYDDRDRLTSASGPYAASYSGTVACQVLRLYLRPLRGQLQLRHGGQDDGQDGRSDRLH